MSNFSPKLQVEHSLKTMRYSIFIIALIIIGGLGLSFSLFAKKGEPLVNYIPSDTELWLWQKSPLSNGNMEAILLALKVDKLVVEVLKKQKEEIVVYNQEGRWFKIVQNNIQKQENVDLEVTRLYEQNSNLSLIGYISPSYITEMLQGYPHPFKVDSSYYFTISKTVSSVKGVFINTGYAKLYKEPPLISYVFPPDIFLILKSQDSQLVSTVRDYAQKQFAEDMAFRYPVIVTTELPDGTSMQEKVVKPELFNWQETSPSIYQLAVNQDESNKYDASEQLKDFSSYIKYYFKDDIFVLGNDVSAIQSVLGESDVFQPSSFLYIDLLSQGGDSFVDIMWKGSGLTWLRNLNAQGIIVREDENWVSFEIRF